MGRGPDPVPDIRVNAVAGDVSGLVVQAQSIEGGVHIHGQAWPAAASGRPVPARRVRDCRARELGVHASIKGEGPSPELPVYVSRDLDIELRVALGTGVNRGCFILLVGGSSTGKTRTAFEAVSQILPEWWLVHPSHSGEIRALTEKPPHQTVVWLDELQRYLDDDDPLGPGTVRALLASGVVLVGTLWPDEYSVRSMPRQPGRKDRNASDRELLELAEIFDIPAVLTAAEHWRAEQVAVIDDRVRHALVMTDAGFTQILAGGPALVRWWQHAPPYGAAAITAAIDARRLGVRVPMTRRLLANAVSGYLTPAQRATAPADWLDRALGYATTLLHGAVMAIEPVDNGDMGGIAGYVAADFLFQHGRRTRRTVCPPDSLWRALIAYHQDLGDLGRLAHSATAKLRYRYSTLLEARLAEAGDESATHALVVRLARQGREKELRHHVEGGDEGAIKALAELLVERGRIDEALALLRVHSPYERFAELLAMHGRLDELRALADSGKRAAAARLADTLAAHGDVDGLRSRVAVGECWAVERLADLMVDHGEVDEAIRLLSIAASFPSHVFNVYGIPRNGRSPGDKLADLLFEHGRAHDLWERAQKGDSRANRRLMDLLADQGRIDELWAHVDAGTDYAAERLADCLVEHGRLKELRAWVDGPARLATDRKRRWARNTAHRRLITYLADQRELDELRARANAVDHHTTYRLVTLLIEHGDLDEAIHVVRSLGGGDDLPAVEIVLDAMIDYGRMDEAIEWLRTMTTRQLRLASLLLEQQHAIEANEIVNRYMSEYGSQMRHDEVANILVALGRTDEAIAIMEATAVDVREGVLFIAWLARHRLTDHLRHYADLRNTQASALLADLLIEEGRLEEVRTRADNGDSAVAGKLVAMLAEQGHIEELRAEVDAGTPEAAERLIELVAAGRVPGLDADLLQRYGLDADSTLRRS